MSVEVPMLYSQSPPLAEKEWLTADETSSGRSARDPDSRSDLRSGMRPLKAPIHSPHPSRLNDREVASDRPSIGRRMLRSLTRFSIAALIGVGATLGWQSYGDAAGDGHSSGSNAGLVVIHFDDEVASRGCNFH